LIFLLAIPEIANDEDTALLVNLYEEIMKIANEKNLINKLANCRSYQEFF